MGNKGSERVPHWQFLTKLNINRALPYHLAIALLGIHPNELKTYVHTNVYSSFIHNCQKLEATKMSLNRRMDKQTAVHHTMGYYPAIRSKELLDLPGGAVVRSPPANAGDTGSIPGPGRSHMLRSN